MGEILKLQVSVQLLLLLLRVLLSSVLGSECLLSKGGYEPPAPKTAFPGCLLCFRSTS